MSRPAPKQGSGHRDARARRFAKIIRNVRDALEASERRSAQLERELAKSVDLTSRSDVVQGGLGNRPAVDSYRNTTLANFMRHINDMGLMGRMFGQAAGGFATRTGVRADFAVIYATAPATLEEARGRDLVSVLLSNPASARVLSGSEVQHERFREDLISLALRSGAEATTWELVRRSPERWEKETRE
jgi:hypothetical protein